MEGMFKELNELINKKETEEVDRCFSDNLNEPERFVECYNDKRNGILNLREKLTFLTVYKKEAVKDLKLRGEGSESNIKRIEESIRKTFEFYMYG